MNAPLVFLDTETTGLSLDDEIWEFAAIRRDPDGTETELHLFIEHDERRCARLPEAFRADHAARFPSKCSGRVSTRREACHQIAELFGADRPHVVGAVPNFDTERVSRMVRTEWPLWPRSEFWHHHLIDVENLAVGYLAGRGGVLDCQPPWNSDVIAQTVGITIAESERHTAMGDARWAMRIYDAVMGSGATGEQQQ